MSPTRGEMEFQYRLLSILERQAKAMERVADAVELLEREVRRSTPKEES